jgi:hypothetical protein
MKTAINTDLINFRKVKLLFCLHFARFSVTFPKCESSDPGKQHKHSFIQTSRSLSSEVEITLNLISCFRDAITSNRAECYITAIDSTTSSRDCTSSEEDYRDPKVLLKLCQQAAYVRPPSAHLQT